MLSMHGPKALNWSVELPEKHNVLTLSFVAGNVIVYRKNKPVELAGKV
jgi:hypothetical protein